MRLKIRAFIKRLRPNRSLTANFLMFCFILMTSIGAGMFAMPAGFIVAGITCGIFGFLLGLD